MVTLGCHSAFWGDSAAYAAQFVDRAHVDYLVGDYLAEVTMSLLARAKAKDASAGFAPDFVTAIAPLLTRFKSRKTRVVTNAGGLNPRGLRDALNQPELRIAVVEGDDLRAQFPGTVSANAYLGAFPIAAALAGGADVVICGRVADSALVLGPLIHEFGWTATDYDKLAAGSLAGHIIECGAQATGGLQTDWRAVADGWSDMGMPIVEVDESGKFVVTKPEGTGGTVTTEAIAEQLLYEIGDPQAYILPDVVCDFSNVTLAQLGKDRVEVTNARGIPPTSTYKVVATKLDGFRVMGTFLVAGGEAKARGRRAAEAILERAARLNDAPFTEASIETIGAENECVVKLAARSPKREALELLANEIAPAACAMAQGITGIIGGRPTPSPVVRPEFHLVEKSRVNVTVDPA